MAEEEKKSSLDSNNDLVLQDLDRYLKTSVSGNNNNANDENNDDTASFFDQESMAMPVAAIKALLGVIQRSAANTMMGLQQELRSAHESMVENSSSKRSSRASCNRTHFGLTSGCELFLKHVTRTFLELEDFDECKKAILERGERFASLSLMARDRIATVACDFVQEGQTVLIHGFSRVVAGILLNAHAQNKHFDVVVLEGRPDASGVKAARFYASKQIPTTVILDSAMAYIMESIDIVLCGAEGVVENGGIVNGMGTYALATCALAHGKPFYVAAESYKFTRLYPLSQRDIPTAHHGGRDGALDFYDTTTTNNKDNNAPRKIELSQGIGVINPPCDYTPAKFITLLFTDLGVLTPSAVSDELIRLYQ